MRFIESCTNLKYAINTDSVISIGDTAFNNCKNVTFYGHDQSSVAKNYAINNRINFSTNYTVTATCYIGIMTNSEIDVVDLINDGSITDVDKAYFQEFVSTTSNPAITLYTSWR